MIYDISKVGMLFLFMLVVEFSRQSRNMRCLWYCDATDNIRPLL